MDNVFVGAGSIILPNVRIGPNAIVAAGSVVTKDVAEGTVVGGNPAKVIGSFDEVMHKRRKESQGVLSYYAGDRLKRVNHEWEKFYTLIEGGFFVVSVIIPCYNCENTIDDTLTSLLKQEYQDFEVICVNDGSVDGTKKVLERWRAAGTLSMRVVSKENGGVSSARNCGLDIAEGEYIVFLDTDDEYHEKYLRKLVGAISRHGADTAYCRLDKVRDNIQCPENTVETVQTQDEAMHNLLYHMGNLGFYCYVYRKNIISENNLRFDLNTKFGEDREFIWKYLCHCKTACFVDAAMYWYQVVETSAIHGKASRRRADTLLAVKRIEQYMKEKNIPFLPLLKDYMFARHMWAVAKKFAVSRDRELFDRLGREYDVKTCMKRTARDKNKLVMLASMLYLLSPGLFFKAVGMMK